MIATCTEGRRPAAFAAVLFLAAVAGCTGPVEYVRNGFNVGPNYHMQPTPVAQHWIDSQDQRVNSSKAMDCAWWRVFNDERLNRLIQMSYEQNLTLPSR